MIALGSNQRHVRWGGPRAILRAAVADLATRQLVVEGVSAWTRSRPLGPSLREYANGAVVVRSGLEPREMLAVLQAIEVAFGRKRQGQRWRSRTLDLDIVLWSGGCWADEVLMVPHREFRARAFVLGPAVQIAPRWRDPVSGLTLKHLRARLTRRAPPPR
nr:2-amino-4-hydroxy-6-hydroxymethyldihydropteridine diphosphokinase [Novosphingobium hassiacum]